MQEVGCGLDHCFLCRHCLPEWKDLVALKKKTYLIKKGRKIFGEGEPVQGLFFINEGAVKVSTAWGRHKELIVRFAKKGDVLGHRGYGGNLHYPVSATTLMDTRVCFISHAFFSTTLAANAGLTYQFMQWYATELQTAEKRMHDLAHRNVKGRISLALLEARDAFGTGDDDFVAVPISRQDIASYAGTTYETVFKFFTEITAKGLLETSGKSFRVVDGEALETYLQEEGE